MATPTDDLYVREDSGDVAGGRTLAIPPGPVPAWLVGFDVNEWVEIPNSSMSDLTLTVTSTGSAGGPSSILHAWGGLELDRRVSKLWSLAGGGHGDWFGNQVLSCDLSQDAPVWVEVLASDSQVSVLSNMPNTGGYYAATGRPASSHLYYNLQFIEQRNRAMRFCAAGQANIGNSSTAVDGYDPDETIGVNGWDAPGTWASALTSDGHGTVAPDMPTCKNPLTGDVYQFQQNYSVRTWTQATNTWSTSAGYPPDEFHGACAYDTVRDRILLFKSGGSSAYYYVPGTNSWQSVTIDPDSTGFSIASGGGIGMLYDEGLDVYIVRTETAGGDLYYIDPVTWVMSKPTTTGGSGIPVTDDLAGANHNVYNKIQYAPELGGVVYVPAWTGNTWFMRTI